MRIYKAVEYKQIKTRKALIVGNSMIKKGRGLPFPYEIIALNSFKGVDASKRRLALAERIW